MQFFVCSVVTEHSNQVTNLQSTSGGDTVNKDTQECHQEQDVYKLLESTVSSSDFKAMRDTAAAATNPYQF